MAKQKKDRIDITTEESKKYVENAIALFIEKEKDGYETRYRSWEKCHDFFKKLFQKYPNKEFDNLEEQDQTLALLNLSFYLASWGMYRGSSFILQHDNTIFKDVITILLKDNYKILQDIKYDTIKENQEEVQKQLKDIRDRINEKLSVYKKFYINKNNLIEKSENEEQENISKTLTTKILLGTLCCCPAYDTYFCNAINSDCNDFYNDKKIKNLLDLIINNQVFKNLSDKYGYPIMKIVDMAYFNIGLEADFKKYYETYFINGEETPPKSDALWKKIAKSIKQFYYKMNIGVNPEVHVGFDCDTKKLTNKLEEFINKHTDEIKKALSRSRKSKIEEE